MTLTFPSPARPDTGRWAHAMRPFTLGIALLLGMLTSAWPQDAAFSNAELDQMLAPIALYPDSLLSQVLMASTYPADVAAAAAWSAKHPDTKGDAAVKQVQNEPWEPAVQSLVAFPQVLAMMKARPDDVQRLGDAFLADPGRVMDRVQVLRKQAQQAGNLKSNEQQEVSTATEENKQVIVIQPAQPQTVYVPVYQPTVVYGTWGYPSYPPYYWAPPPYYYPPSSGSFVAGMFWGAAIVGVSNSLWGGVNWGRGDVDINVNHYNNINVNKLDAKGGNKFVHNSERRGDVPYRDSKSREQYGKKQLDGAKDREAYRGKEGGKDGRDAERAKANEALKSRGVDPVAGREKLQGADRDKAAAAVRDTDRSKMGDAAGKVDRDKVGAAAGNLDRSKMGDAAGNLDRSKVGNAAGNVDRSKIANAGGGADRSRPAPGGGGPAAGANRTASTGAKNNALAGAGNPGAARASADRGHASSQSMKQHAGGGSRAAAGGGARAGGGGRQR